MLTRTVRTFLVLVFVCAPLACGQLSADDLPRIDRRFADGETDEVPDFQRHVVPLFGRLGCNGRACHGSFQGRGGFRLSLFGYDFEADHKALTDKENARVDVSDPDESLIIAKPTDADEHEGGERYKVGSWEYHVLRKWIEGGAVYDVEHQHKLMRLEVTPAEIIFEKKHETRALQVFAVWQDGTREEVTPLCRFRSNDEEIAQIDSSGQVTAGGPGDTHVVVMYDLGVKPVPVLQPVSNRLGEHYPEIPTPTKIDSLVVAKLSKLGIIPSDVCTDADFLRRVSLDLAGTLPTPSEVEEFLNDKRHDKRSRKIDELLETPGYAALWTTRLCDYTGNNETQLVNAIPTRNGQASQDWYDWIFKRVADNTPYDEIAAGIVTAQSRHAGQSYEQYCKEMSQLYSGDGSGSFADRDAMPYYWARRDFRAKEARAIGVAYSFLGIRIQCAQCHKHPFDQWTKQDFAQFQNFFDGVVASNRPPRKDQAEYNQLLKKLGLNNKNGGQARREIQKKLRNGETVPFPEVYVVKTPARPAGRGQSRSRGPTEAKLPGGGIVDLTEFDDPREALMQWMRSEDNPYFARAFVNRVWASYFGLGIVDPPDDMSLGNPPSNQPLLDYLAEGFVQHQYDMKWLHREITNSRTYQLSWKPNETNLTDRRNFSHALPRRLPAEVVYDAIRQATASPQQLTAIHTNLEGRALSLPGTGARGGRGAAERYALTVFGRSTRESNCDCDRSADPSLLQTVYLQNDRDILSALVRQDGWISKLSADLGEPQAAAQQKRPPNYEKLVSAQRARIRRLRKAGKTAQANQVQRQLGQYLRRFGDPESEVAQAEKQKPQVDVDQLVRQAYLRTLSRYPEKDESMAAREYIDSAKDVSAGVRDVLWALVNTKEFIVNH